MEQQKISLLSRFDTISHVMPYYSFTHKAFLLLSSLCSDSRWKLNEYYKEIVQCMSKFWMCISIDSSNIQKSLLLPCDLFVFSIDWLSVEDMFTFIQFIEDLANIKGWFFNGHYMHSQLKLSSLIKIDISLIEKLRPHVDLLKSTQVTLLDNSNQQTTLDTMCLKI